MERRVGLSDWKTRISWLVSGLKRTVVNMAQQTLQLYNCSASFWWNPSLLSLWFLSDFSLACCSEQRVLESIHLNIACVCQKNWEQASTEEIDITMKHLDHTCGNWLSVFVVSTARTHCSIFIPSPQRVIIHFSFLVIFTILLYAASFRFFFWIHLHPSCVFRRVFVAITEALWSFFKWGPLIWPAPPSFASELIR